MGIPSPQYSYGASTSTKTMTSTLESKNENLIHRTATGGLPAPQNSVNTSHNGDSLVQNIWSNSNYSFGTQIRSNDPSPRPRASPARYNIPTKETQLSVSTKRAEASGQNGASSYPAPPSAWSRPNNNFVKINSYEPLGLGSARTNNNNNGRLSNDAAHNSNSSHQTTSISGQNQHSLNISRGSSDTNLSKYHTLQGTIESSNSPNDLHDLFIAVNDRFHNNQRSTIRAEPSGQPSPTEDWNNGVSDHLAHSSSNTSHRGSLPPSRAEHNSSKTPDGNSYPRSGRLDNLGFNFTNSSNGSDINMPRGKSQAPPGLELYQSGLTQSYDMNSGSSNENKDLVHTRRSSNIGSSTTFQPRNSLEPRTVNGPLYGINDGKQQVHLTPGNRISAFSNPDEPSIMPFENQYTFLGNQRHAIRNGSVTPRRMPRSYQNSSRSSPHSGVEQSALAPPSFRYGLDQTSTNPQDLQEVTERFSRMLSDQHADGFINPHLPLLADQAPVHYQHPWIYRDTQINSIHQYSSVPQISTSILTQSSSQSRSRDVEVDPGLRSSKLQEFKSSHGLKNNRPWEIKDIYGHLSEFCGDQQGSRFVQNKLKDGLNSDEMQRVFTEIEPNALQLMMDVFGNYVMQKLFEHATQVQKIMLANKMRGHVLKLALQVYGCRSVQKAFEHILVDQQAILVKELEGHVLTCVDDQHGNHCIQMAIAHIPIVHIPFIADAFRNRVEEYATHTFGCRVIQRLLEKCKGAAKSRLLQELHATGSRIITNQFGNYVTQHMIRHGTEEDRAQIFTHIQAQIIAFSRQKFASNVVEACIEKGTDEQKRIIMTKMCQLNERGTSPLPVLIGDSYANYVLQKLLVHLKQPDLGYFVEVLRPEIMKARRLNPTKHVEHLYAKVMTGPTQPGAQEMN